MQARKQRDIGMKIAVALEAIRGGRTLKQIAADFGVHPVQVSTWKRMFRDNLERMISAGGPAKQDGSGKPRQQEDSLQVEHRWMREKLAGLKAEVRRGLIEPSGSFLSLRKQCRLLGITRSSLYYRKKSERPENLELMARIREFASRFPGFGVVRMTKALREAGLAVNPKRVRRLMRKLMLSLAFLHYLPLTPLIQHGHRLARFH